MTGRGQSRLYLTFLLPRRPPGPYSPRHYIMGESPKFSPEFAEVIANPLYEVIQLRVRLERVSA
jgi:hypothetical protein